MYLLKRTQESPFFVKNSLKVTGRVPNWRLKEDRGQGQVWAAYSPSPFPTSPHLPPPHTHTEIHTLPSLLCPVPRGVTPADPSPAPCPLASDWAQLMGGTGSGQEGGWAERSHHDIHPLSLPEGDLP